jgi:hypothetical protein
MLGIYEAQMGSYQAGLALGAAPPLETVKFTKS